MSCGELNLEVMEAWEWWQVLGSCVNQTVGRGRKYAERSRGIEQTSGERGRDGDWAGSVSSESCILSLNLTF